MVPEIEMDGAFVMELTTHNTRKELFTTLDAMASIFGLGVTMEFAMDRSAWSKAAAADPSVSDPEWHAKWARWLDAWKRQHMKDYVELQHLEADLLYP